MTNFIGRESMTDLMSFVAAADDPDIFGVCECVLYVWYVCVKNGIVVRGNAMDQ